MNVQSFQGQTVLIVDDQPSNLQVLSDTLSAANLQVAVALDGESALEQMQHFQPDLILLDIMMPGMDGFETCRQILNNPETCNIPVLFMTALADLDYKNKGFSIGAVDYITKPFQQQEVFARVKVHLRLHSMHKLLMQQNQQLQVERNKAEQASRVKSRFLANMSHELRTPLNGVMGYAQGLQMSDSLNERESHWVNSIYECGSHLLMLINDVLDISKIEADKLELLIEPFNLAQFLEQLVAMFKLRAEQSELEFRVEVSSTLPAIICADQKRLRQVLVNLLGNAFKFTKQGHVLLVVQPLGFSESTSQPRLRFEIQDTGPGIEPCDQLKVFEPFEQVFTEQSTSQGTGLGLSISQGILEMMGSNLELCSHVGVGSQFSFELDVEIGNGQLPLLQPQTI